MEFPIILNFPNLYPKYMYYLYKIYTKSKGYKSIFFRLKSYINLSRYSFHLKDKKNLIFRYFWVFGLLI